MAQPQPPGVQLPLDVQLRDDATLANFFATPRTQPIVELLGESPAAASEQMLYFHGPAGSGKSHLLQAACHTAGANSIYLPLTELKSFEPASVLAGIDELRRICLDDLQAVAGLADWETALFHLINRTRERGNQLVFAGDNPPGQLPVNLADLQSRLAWCLVLALPAADDDELAGILLHRAARRGLNVAPDVAPYIVSRAARDPGNLIDMLDILDRESLTQQRAISIPFVRALMNW